MLTAFTTEETEGSNFTPEAQNPHFGLLNSGEAYSCSLLAVNRGTKTLRPARKGHENVGKLLRARGAACICDSQES